MKIDQVIAVSNQIAKGKQFTVVYGKTLGIKKTSGFIGEITKVTRMNVRLVNYENQQSVQEKRDNGMEKQPNHWEKLAEGVYMDHNKQYKMCIAPSKLKNQKNTSEYFVNGSPIEYAEIESVLLAKDKKKTSEFQPDWFTLKTENLIEIIA